MTKYLTCAETAKLLRTILKEQFQDTRFSVKSKTYSGGASITVRWTEGPSSENVRKITSLFQGATFDPMIDLKSYQKFNVEGQQVQFGADYIFTERTNA